MHPAGSSGLQQQNRIKVLPWWALACAHVLKKLPVISIEAVTRGDLSVNPSAWRKLFGPGRNGSDGFFFFHLSPTFLVHYFRPQESILHHVNLM